MATLTIRPFHAHQPHIGTGLRAGKGCVIIGRVQLGANATFGADCVLRGDGHDISAGAHLILGPRTTVHIAHDQWPAIIGARVAADQNSIIHACTLGDDVVIGADVVILDGSTIGAGALLEPGTIVFPGSHLAGGLRYKGQPAVAQGPVSPEERQLARAAILAKIERAQPSPITPSPTPSSPVPTQALFVAETAQLIGDIRLATDSSVFFSTQIDAGTHYVSVGAETNIQDNCTLSAREQPLLIGAATTLGHNVRADSCTIGTQCLIGMGAVIGAGAVIEDDVLVAAGTIVPPGARLSRGHLWGGDPLRILSPLKDRHRHMITTTIVHYKDYARVFAKEPDLRPCL